MMKLCVLLIQDVLTSYIYINILHYFTFTSFCSNNVKTVGLALAQELLINIVSLSCLFVANVTIV